MQMSRILLWNNVMAASLLGASLLVPFEVQAEKIRVVSGLIGGQDAESNKLLALSPTDADQVATQHLLSILKPAGKFTQDNSRNVEGMTFVTQPYATTYPYVCRQDRITLRYQYQDRFDATGKWLGDERRPVGVEAQATFHIAQLPVPGFIPGTSYSVPVCEALHPNVSVRWIAAPRDTDAILAANMFRMAEDDVNAGRLMPGPCDPHGALNCRQWLHSLDDPSKINSVEPCTTSSNDSACYVVSFDSVDVTITGKISRDDVEAITPAAITSVRVDNVITVRE
jgi:hypothetical protein